MGLKMDAFYGYDEGHDERYKKIQDEITNEITKAAIYDSHLWRSIIKDVGEDAEANSLIDYSLPANHYRGMIISELGEAIQADRNNKHADYDEFVMLLGKMQPDNIYGSDIAGHWEQIDKTLYKTLFFERIEGTLEDELADVVLRMCSFAYMFKMLICPTYCKELYRIDGIKTFPEFINFICQRICEEVGTGSICYTNFDKALTYIFYYCKKNNIDIQRAIVCKYYYNKLREPGHGKLY